MRPGARSRSGCRALHARHSRRVSFRAEKTRGQARPPRWRSVLGGDSTQPVAAGGATWSPVCEPPHFDRSSSRRRTAFCAPQAAPPIYHAHAESLVLGVVDRSFGAPRRRPHVCGGDAPGGASLRSRARVSRRALPRQLRASSVGPCAFVAGRGFEPTRAGASRPVGLADRTALSSARADRAAGSRHTAKPACPAEDPQSSAPSVPKRPWRRPLRSRSAGGRRPVLGGDRPIGP